MWLHIDVEVAWRRNFVGFFNWHRLDQAILWICQSSHEDWNPQPKDNPYAVNLDGKYVYDQIHRTAAMESTPQFCMSKVRVHWRSCLAFFFNLTEQSCRL